MKILFVFVVCLLTSGCTTVLHAYADAQDQKDSCQTQEFSPRTGARLKPAGYSIKDFPDWCGASSAGKRITNTAGQTLGYIK